MTTEAIAVREAEDLIAWSPRQLKAQMDLVHQVMRDLMVPGEHYGVIPGTERKDKDGKDISKPTLKKPGAEKLSCSFRLVPEFDILETDLPAGHKNFRVGCKLFSINTGKQWGGGVGYASTMETKYRYRESKRKCPACGAEAIVKGKVEYGGGWLCFKKTGGCGAKYVDNETSIVSQVIGRTENPDIADTYNTVIKMAKKRAFVDATIQALAVSDIFTQDLEDTGGDEPPKAPAAPNAKDVMPPKPDSGAEQHFHDALVNDMPPPEQPDPAEIAWAQANKADQLRILEVMIAETKYDRKLLTEPLEAFTANKRKEFWKYLRAKGMP